MAAKNTLKELVEIYKKYGRDLPRIKRELTRCIRKGRETGDFLLIGASYYYLALASWRSGGERDSVLLYAINSAAMLEQSGEFRMIAKCSNMLGIAYLGQENFQLALEAFKRAYQIAKRYRSCGLDNKLITLNNIGECYYEMGDYKLGIKLFSDCLREAMEKNPDNHYNIAVYRLNLANCCDKSGEYQKALEILDPMAEWIDELKNKMWICIYYARRASVLFAMGRADEGNFCADKALAVVGNGEDTYEVHKEFEELAHALLRLGDHERALTFGKVLGDFAEKSGHTIDRLKACRVMADHYARSGQLELAVKKYEELNTLFEKRSIELKAMQLTVNRKMEEAEREIRKLTKSIKTKEEAASREPLTGLLNRTALLNTASEFINIAQKKRETVGAVFIDIDYFKQCNDTYGHAQGDEVIRRVARACMEEERENVRFARYGGDEFFGIMHGLSDDQVRDIARGICRRIREADIPNAKNPNGGRITLSVGVVNERLTERTNTIIDVVNFADKALYHAKDSGRNSIFMLDYDYIDENGDRSLFVRVEL